MGLIITILLGALVGFLAARFFGRSEGFLASLVIGILGAVVGNIVSHALGQGSQSNLGLDLNGLLWALGGSVIVVVILNMIQGRSNRPPRL